MTPSRHASPRPRPHLRAPLVLGLLAATASCVPDGAATRPALAIAPAPAPAALPDGVIAAGDAAAAANAAIPIADGPNLRAKGFHAGKASIADRLRALDCLADAVYYEARSETEDGQRAVAQVVLNRVRHPAYPGSVCGVVYQGPMRAGGGCQFSFTCDGALARPRLEPGWSRARRIAAAALAGHVYAPVGLATHYHTQAILPQWASSLEKSAVVGAHIFYRWAGGWGRPAAFRQAYAGRETGRRNSMAKAVAAPQPFVPAVPPTAAFAPVVETAWIPAPPDTLPQPKLTRSGLPESRVREEYRNSGAWRTAAN